MVQTSSFFVRKNIFINLQEHKRQNIAFFTQEKNKQGDHLIPRREGIAT
jgi:hypothetical protein